MCSPRSEDIISKKNYLLFYSLIGLFQLIRMHPHCILMSDNCVFGGYLLVKLEMSWGGGGV